VYIYYITNNNTQYKIHYIFIHIYYTNTSAPVLKKISVC